MSGTGIGYMGLIQGCYAMSGTDLAYSGMGLISCYATSSTDIAYAGMGLRAYQAMSGTDMAYGGRGGTERTIT
eukprot:3435600-Rhodomonas_salina.17